ncbi:hypothetical protein ACFFQW_09020 [Umezawaea endophytica]|uniref:Uncharacterized protein n=1 Tax=Umezawaea endophytica TaxID=1654476 RepID=A0A9X2VGI1_9PSEU|nr:hypothetical protein [Umezawaea endophytica]MCS7476126.1 hypothetical protein [Umezawaea endophytica]
MVVNSIRRILVAVVLCLGITGGFGVGLAQADVHVTTEPGEVFTPPYQAN